MKITLTSLILFSTLITGAHAGQIETMNSASMVSFGEAPAPLPETTTSAKTRAEVWSELAAAREAGLISYEEAPAPLPRRITNSKAENASVSMGTGWHIYGAKLAPRLHQVLPSEISALS